MGKLTLFVGVPCSGKTTHRNRHYQHAITVSRDDMRENVIKSFKIEGIYLSYADLFITPTEGQTEHKLLGKVVDGEFEVIKEANRRLGLHFDATIKHAKKQLENGREVVVDMLNTTLSERKLMIDSITPDQGVELSCAAIVFRSEEHMSKIKLLNEKRSMAGKSIPFSIIEGYGKSIEIPSLDEGFDEIRLVNGLA